MPALRPGQQLLLLMWPLLLLLLAVVASEPTSTTTATSTTTETESSTHPPLPLPTPPEQPPLQPPPPPPPQQSGALRKSSAEVLVIDMTRNTSSVVSIPLPPGGSVDTANLTVADLQHRRVASSLRCLTQHRANIFLVMHLNRNWRKKLDFARQLLRYAYEQSSTNVAIVLFNEFTSILATFGTDPLTSEAEVLLALTRVQAVMERDESAAVSEHWASFRLEDALKASFRYARLFLHQFSLDARPSLMFSYFDDGAVVSDSTVEEAAKVMKDFQSASPFVATVSMLQWPENLPVPRQWSQVTELLSSSPGYQIIGPSVDSLMTSAAQLVAEICRGLVPV